ncbi:hypothetical protein PRK78_001412 [Emydomyces testavorans]|uniref:Ankyrin repeat protein n=1 Tax=Emydomyces testavorans TaxID=2070801 RepID=A0AAF0IGN4_9EURO|nr:hypothetical protein PRK78_001412 [Emydomyces testavorans]
MSLTALPTELILQVADYLAEPDLNRFVQTSKAAAEVLTPALYDRGFSCATFPRSELLGHLLNADEAAVAVNFYGLLLKNQSISSGSKSDSSRLTRTKLFSISRFRALPCLRLWKSPYITDYFTHHLSQSKLVSSTDEQQISLLHIIAEAGNAAVAHILIDRGANVNATDYYRRQPLHLACSEGRTETIKLLLDSGANILAQDSFGITPFAYVARANNPDAMTVVVEYAKRINGDLFLPNIDGATPLHTAAADGDEKTVRYLLDLGGDPCAVDRVGRPPLERAIGGSKLRVARVLVEEMIRIGWDVSSSYAGRTALHDAVWVKNRAIIKFLVGVGANVEQQDVFGKTPTDIALQWKVPLNWFDCAERQKT